MVIAVDRLDAILEETWHTLSCTYDVSKEMPEMWMLFGGADLQDPIEAAERVVLNMLVAITEYVSRFSPWYTKPARAFGIMRLRDSGAGEARWFLAPEAVQRWQPQLQRLTDEIRMNSGVLEADRLVDELLASHPTHNPCIMATCGCVPERSILVNQHVLDSGEITCSECHEPFQQIA